MSSVLLQCLAWLTVLCAAALGLTPKMNRLLEKGESRFLIKIGFVASLISIFLSYAISFLSGAIKNNMFAIITMESVGMGGVFIPVSYSILAFGLGLAVSKFIRGQCGE